jgi:hypothetical protein
MCLGPLPARFSRTGVLALPIGAGPGLGRTVIEEQQLIAVIKFNAINSGVNKNDKRRLLLRAPHVTANSSSFPLSVLVVVFADDARAQRYSEPMIPVTLE